MTIGQWIHQYREENQLSMADFAKKTGVSKASIGFLEKGSSNPTTKTLTKIAKALGITVQEMLDHIDSDSVISISPPTPSLSPDEEELLGKYRQLSDAGKEYVMDQVDFKLEKEAAKARDTAAIA